MESRRYMIWVIVLSAAAAAGIVCIYGMTMIAFLYMVSSLCLAAIAVEDAMTKEIHDILLGCLLVLGIAACFIDGSVNGSVGAGERVAGSLCVSVPMACMGAAMKNSLGMGDVFLCCFGGFLLGWERICIAVMGACIAAGIYGAVMLALGKKGLKDTFAFGPFLCGGIWVMMVI